MAKRPPKKIWSYAGLCTICGAREIFVGYGRNRRESFPCPVCGAPHLYREMAGAILTVFARGKSHFLAHFTRQDECKRLDILEFALGGPLSRKLNAVPGYQRAFPLEDAAPGDVLHGVRCERLPNLTFDDASFDLVLTSDLMEHDFDIDGTTREIARVLRPGGAHIFSVPLKFPLEEKTATLAQMTDGGIETVGPARYDTPAFDDPKLVVSEFGADLMDKLAAHGFSARFFHGTPLLAHLRDCACVIARKVR